MGICSSCLGRVDDPTSYEEETARLLNHDATTNQYGSFPNGVITQADPLEVQRERAALQKVVIQTSNHLVDIFALLEPGSTPETEDVPHATLKTTFSGQDARALRYQDVLAKMSTADAANKGKQPMIDDSQDGWASEDEEEVQNQIPARPMDVGPLLGGFRDAQWTSK